LAMPGTAEQSAASWATTFEPWSNWPPVQLTRELISCRFPLLDGTGNHLVDLAIRCVANLVERGIPTLVC
jgi:hypothetical protein